LSAARGAWRVAAAAAAGVRRGRGGAEAVRVVSGLGRGKIVPRWLGLSLMNRIEVRVRFS